MRIAIIENGVVLNAIIVDQDYVVDGGLEAVESDVAGPGWLFDGQTFTPPTVELVVESSQEMTFSPVIPNGA
jgi:hypothetical protein